MDRRISCLDQVWTNVPETSIGTFVHTRGASDHHVVGVSIRIKGFEGEKLEYFSRKRKNFNLDRYREKLKNCNWDDFYSISELDKANHWLEEKLREILQEEFAPFQTNQPNKKLKKLG